jgi:hypothetical protein
MATTRAKVFELGGGLQIHLAGPQVAKFDPKLVEGCANALFACAEDNACLQQGLKITGSCVETLVRHNARTRCFDKGFGLKVRAGR